MQSSAIQLPDLGARGEPIHVSGWLVDVGDFVDEGDRLVEVSLPGVTFDVAAPVSGIFARIDKPYGSAVKAGDVLGWIRPDLEGID